LPIILPVSLAGWGSVRLGAGAWKGQGILHSCCQRFANEMRRQPAQIRLILFKPNRIFRVFGRMSLAHNEPFLGSRRGIKAHGDRLQMLGNPLI